MVGCRYKQSTKTFFTQLFQQTIIPKAATLSFCHTHISGRQHKTKRSSHKLFGYHTHVGRVLNWISKNPSGYHQLGSHKKESMGIKQCDIQVDTCIPGISSLRTSVTHIHGDETQIG